VIGWLVVDREFSETDVESDSFANALLTDVNRALRRLSLSARLRARAGQLFQTAIDSVGALTVSYGEFKVSVDTKWRNAPIRRLDDDLKEALTRISPNCAKRASTRGWSCGMTSFTSCESGSERPL
jgi:hypothetical protein